MVGTAGHQILMRRATSNNDGMESGRRNAAVSNMSLSNSGGRIGVVWEEEAIHCSQGQLGKWQCHVTHTQIPVRLIRMLNLLFSSLDSFVRRPYISARLKDNICLESEH
jgi:hypothetical protein